MDKLLTQSQYLISLSPFPDLYFNTFSGVEMTADYSEVSDGLDRFFLTGPMTVQPFTIGRTSSVDDNKLIWDWAQTFCRSSSDAVLSIIPLKPCQSIEPWDKTLRILGVIPNSIRMFAADKNSNDLSTVEIGMISRHTAYG